MIIKETIIGDCRLLLGDSRLILPALEADSVGVAITDPPFGAQTHAGAQTGANGGIKLVHFDSMTAKEIGDIFQDLATRIVKRWVVATIEWRHALELESREILIRLGVWVKPNGAPQFTGDRPGTGWEAVAICHREGRKRWNRGGHHATWIHNKISGEHPTQKPLGLIAEWVEAFSDDGETILDPFMGVGTTGVACVKTGRPFVGIEIDPTYYEIACRRIGEAWGVGSLFRDVSKENQTLFAESL